MLSISCCDAIFVLRVWVPDGGTDLIRFGGTPPNWLLMVVENSNKALIAHDSLDPNLKIAAPRKKSNSVPRRSTGFITNSHRLSSSSCSAALGAWTCARHGSNGLLTPYQTQGISTLLASFYYSTCQMSAAAFDFWEFVMTSLHRGI